MGMAAAMAWFLLAVVLLLTLLVFRSSALWVFYETEVK
jgi:multiple sugar transport system permease protein